MPGLFARPVPDCARCDLTIWEPHCNPRGECLAAVEVTRSVSEDRISLGEEGEELSL